MRNAKDCLGNEPRQTKDSAYENRHQDGEQIQVIAKRFLFETI